MSTAADPVASASTAGGTGAGALARPLVRRGVLAVLCGQFVALALLQAWSDALTFDESPHLAQGLSALVHRDLRVNPEHPVLPAVLAAVPALAAGPDVPRTEAWEANRYFDYADEVVAAQVEDDRLRVVVFLSRLVPIAVALGCGLLLYVCLLYTSPSPRD